MLYKSGYYLLYYVKKKKKDVCIKIWNLLISSE
jgi:hypothetical protein